MSAATTLIFGGSGKVARHLTRQLAAEGHKVYSIIVRTLCYVKLRL